MTTTATFKNEMNLHVSDGNCWCDKDIACIPYWKINRGDLDDGPRAWRIYPLTNRASQFVHSLCTSDDECSQRLLVAALSGSDLEAAFRREGVEKLLEPFAFLVLDEPLDNLENLLSLLARNYCTATVDATHENQRIGIQKPHWTAGWDV